MKRSLLNFLFLFALFLFFSCGEKPTEGVEKLFAAYQTAVKQGQYGKAAGLVDDKSIEYYNQIIKLALDTKRKKLGAMNFNSKVMALALRQEFSKKELKELTGAQVFAFTLEHHINPLDSIELYSIAKTVMESDMNKAVSRMYRKGELTDTYLKFLKENNQWKMNFASVMNDENDLKTSIELSGIRDENKRAINLVQSISKKRLKRNIWTPANLW